MSLRHFTNDTTRWVLRECIAYAAAAEHKRLAAGEMGVLAYLQHKCEKNSMSWDEYSALCDELEIEPCNWRNYNPAT